MLSSDPHGLEVKEQKNWSPAELRVKVQEGNSAELRETKSTRWGPAELLLVSYCQ